MIVTPKKSLQFLKENLDSLIKEYVDEHIEVMSSPVKYDRDVRAFIILSHSAFEGFIEEISNYVLQKSIERFIRHRKTSRALLTLMLHYGSYDKIKRILSNFNESDQWSSLRAFDLMKESLEKAKEIHSSVIINNNGFEFTYCCKILLPVAVDITNDIRLRASVESIKNLRGNYAHTLRTHNGIIRSTTPESAKQIVEDCYSFCEHIYQSAIKWNH